MRSFFMRVPGRFTLSKTVVVALVVGVVASMCYWRVQAQTPPAAAPPNEAMAALIAGRGELVYVPIYSSIFYDTGKHTLEMAATLAIHNINPDRPITVTRADYYNTAGKLIKKYFDKPLTLAPLQTTNVVIERGNVTGGPGANFLVEWQGNSETVSPLIEAVMVNAASNLGIAFTTSGKVVRRTGAAQQ
jgi:Protein of unknown function (DUF3124)